MADSLRPPPVPAVLRLVQTVVAGRWRATGEKLYREVAAITEAGPGRDLVVVGAGEGITVEWLAARTGAQVTGVDPDVERVDGAEKRRRSGLSQAAAQTSFEVAPLEDLPHENDVFDAAIGEPALSGAADIGKAIGELVRVTKPMGQIVLLQPTWTSEISEGTRDLLRDRLQLSPRLVVEWKQMLRESGVVEIQVQDWSDGSPATRATAGASPRLSFPQKAQIVGRAFRRAGLKAARAALERETQLLKELSRERALGFHLIYGVKWPHAKERS